MAEEILRVFSTTTIKKIKFSNTENKSKKKRVKIGNFILAAKSL